MNANIYSNTTLIGTALLKPIDISMGKISGEFAPTNEYSEIRNVFQNFNKAQVNYSELELLRLNIQLENGFFISPEDSLFIIDQYKSSHEELTVQMEGVNAFFIHHFIEKSPPSLTTDFLPDSWELPDINYKLALENELIKEIGRKGHSRHPLSNFKYSAIAHDTQCDDVLFAIHGHEDYSLVVIHLTWKMDREYNTDFPTAEFYTDFRHFQKFSAISGE